MEETNEGISWEKASRQRTKVLYRTASNKQMRIEPTQGKGNRA
jgi:hypothetical protein